MTTFLSEYEILPFHIIVENLILFAEEKSIYSEAFPLDKNVSWTSARTEFCHLLAFQLVTRDEDGYANERVGSKN